MSDIPFHQTAMGRDFFDRTVPALVEQLTRIADLLEKLASRQGADGR
jgi:hypothetical protein